MTSTVGAGLPFLRALSSAANVLADVDPAHLQCDGRVLRCSHQVTLTPDIPGTPIYYTTEQRHAWVHAGGQQHYLQRHDGHGDHAAWRPSLPVITSRSPCDARGLRRHFCDYRDRDQHLHLHLAHRACHQRKWHGHNGHGRHAVLWADRHQHDHRTAGGDGRGRRHVALPDRVLRLSSCRGHAAHRPGRPPTSWAGSSTARARRRPITPCRRSPTTRRSRLPMRSRRCL